MQTGERVQSFAISGFLMLVMVPFALANDTETGVAATQSNPYSKADSEWYSYLARHGYRLYKNGHPYSQGRRGLIPADIPKLQPKEQGGASFESGNYYREKHEVFVSDSNRWPPIGSRGEVDCFIHGSCESLRGFDEALLDAK